MPQPDFEQSITSLIASGDFRAAAEQLVVAYGSEMIGRCANLVGDRFVAEDLAQDVFSRAFTGLAGFRGESTLRTWLFTIARNVCVDHHRRVLGASRLHDADADSEEQPDEKPFLLELMSDREQLSRALAALEESERALVVLRYVHGLGYAELAESFGIKQGTTRMRLCRALGRMRETLTPCPPRKATVPWTRIAPESPERSAAPVDQEIDELHPAFELSFESAEAVEIPAPVATRPLEVRDARVGAALDLYASPPDELGRAFGRILETLESGPAATSLLRQLEPAIGRLAATDSPTRRSRSWLRRLFGRR